MGEQADGSNASQAPIFSSTTGAAGPSSAASRGSGEGVSAAARSAAHAGRQAWDRCPWQQPQHSPGMETRSQEPQQLHTLSVHNVHKSLSEVELMDFMNGSLLVATENDLEDCAGVAPCDFCSIDQNTCSATLGFRTAVGASAALWLDGVECRGPRLRITRPRDYVVPEGGDPALSVCVSITTVPLWALIGGPPIERPDRQETGITSWYDIEVGASENQQHQRQNWESYAKGPPYAKGPSSHACRRKSHYEILEVTALAGADEIRKAFVERCRSLHPDALDGSPVDEFYEVTEAYRTLSSPSRRAVYDEQRLIHDVCDGHLQFDLKAVAFLLRHPFAPIQRMTLNRRHTQLMAAGTMTGVWKNQCGADVLFLNDQSQTASQDLPALIAGHPSAIELAKISILDHIAELDGLRAPKAGFVVVVPIEVRSKLATIQQDSSKIAMQTHTGLTFAEDRIILRGANAMLCVSSVQWYLDWRGRVLLPDGRTLDPWMFAYEMDLTTKRSVGALVPCAEPEMEVVWQVLASAMHQRVYSIPPATRGNFTKWVTQVFEAMLKGSSIFSLVVVRAATCNRACQEIMSSPPDHQARFIHVLHKMCNQFDMRTCLERFSNHPLTVAVNDLRVHFQDLTQGLEHRGQGFIAIREAVPQENKWQSWDELLKPRSQLVNFLTDMLGWVSSRHADLGMVPTDWSMIPAVAASILPLCGGDSVRVDIDSGVQRVPCEPTPPPVTLKPPTRTFQAESPQSPPPPPRLRSRQRFKSREPSPSPSRSRKEKKDKKDDAHRREELHKKDDSHKRSKVDLAPEEAARLTLCECVEEVLYSLMSDDKWIPVGTVSKETQYCLGPSHRSRVSKKWLEDYPKSFELRPFRNGKPCSSSRSRHEDEWRVALTDSCRSRVGARVKTRKAEDKRQTLLARAETLINDSAVSPDVTNLTPCEVAALLIMLERAPVQDGFAAACLDRLYSWQGSSSSATKKLHSAMMPFPPARVMQAVVALDQSGGEEWNESALLSLVQCAALDLHGYGGEWPRATLAMVALSLKNAARQPFRERLEVEKCLLVPAAVLRMEVELSEGECLCPAGRDFLCFAQMCAWLAMILKECGLPLAHQKEMLRGFTKLVTACEDLDKKPGVASYSPEGLCRLISAIAIATRHARSVIKWSPTDDEDAQKMAAQGFALRALDSLGRCVLCQGVEQAANWSPHHLSSLCTAFSLFEEPNEAVFRHAAALAEEHGRTGVEWSPKHFWNLLKAAWGLGLLSAMEPLLKRLEATGGLMQHVTAASLKDLPLVFSVSVALDSPATLQGFVGPSLQTEDLSEISLVDLVNILQTWPMSDHNDPWSAMQGLREQILTAAVASTRSAEGQGPTSLPQAQVVSLLRMVLASDSVQEHLDVLSTAQTLLNVLGAASSPSAVYTDIAQLLRPFARHGVAAPRLEATCMAWLLRTMQESGSGSQDLRRLVDGIRLLDVAGALMAMPAALAAIAQLPLVQRSVNAHCNSNDAVLIDLLRLLLSVAERAVHVQKHGGDAGREDDLMDNWVLLLEAVVRDLAGCDGWNVESAGEAGQKPTEWTLEAVSKRAREKLDVQAAQDALGPLWLEALLVRSNRLYWSGGTGVCRMEARPELAAQAFAEAFSGVDMHSPSDASSTGDAVWQPPVLLVKGQRNLPITQTLCGTYVLSGENHGRNVYTRTAPSDGLEVFIYHWEEDGQCGWWFGSEVGSDEVWAHHAGELDQDRPPEDGWEILLNESDEDPKLVVIDCGHDAQPSAALPPTPSEPPASPDYQESSPIRRDPCQESRDESPPLHRYAARSRSPLHRYAARSRSPHRWSTTNGRRGQISMEEELALLRRRAEEAEAKLAAMENQERKADFRSILTRVATPLAPNSRTSEDPPLVHDDSSDHVPPPESRACSTSNGASTSSTAPGLQGVHASSSSSAGETLEDTAAFCKRKREESKSSREEKLKAWLDSLDDGAGSMLQYYDILEAEFEADLAQISAVKVENHTGGIIDAVDPVFWEIVKVSKMGHKMLLARGIARL